MAIINEYGLLVNNDRVFLPSETINVFPCSRRGLDDTSEDSVKYYDPEARLNTERTNRLHTAVNGFKDSFIINNSFTTGGTLVFVLAGYHIEIKNFDPSAVADALGTETATVYAHLRLHNNVSLDAENYFTEMLYRQSDSASDKNYLDVIYTDEADTDKSDYFFVGVSFIKAPVNESDPVAYNLPLFSYSTVSDSWELVQTSLLPRVEHGETVDSIKVSGDFTVKHGSEAEFKVAADEDGYWGAKFTVPVTVENSLESTSSIKTPTLDVKTIKNTATEGTNLGVSIDDTLSVTGATSVTNTITAKKLIIPSNIGEDGKEKGEVITPKLRVDTITSNSSSIIVDDKKLLVTKSLEVLAKKAIDEADQKTPALATIDKAIIGELTVKADADELLNGTGQITADTVNSDDINQKIDGNYYDVPVIFVQQLNSTESNEYQLQIVRANVLPYKAN